MGVQRPAWWFYPERCENGHEWAPGRVLVSFTAATARPCGPLTGRQVTWAT